MPSVIFSQPVESASSESDNVVVIIIDGARYSETFGDPDYTHIPQMAKLAEVLNNYAGKLDEATALMQ